MSDQTSSAALVANVNVEQVKQALADIKAALGEMSSAARGASDALGSLNNVPLTGAIEHVRALNLEIERTVQLAGAARGGLAGLGGGVSGGAGGGGGAMAVGLGGESASLSGPKGTMLAADIMATPEQRLSNARVVMANAKAEGILTTGERNAVSEGLNRYGTSIFGEMTWATGSVAKLKAFAAERGALLAAAPAGLLASLDPAIAHHLGMAGGGNPWLAALGGGAGILGSMVFGRGAGEDETLFGSMFPGIPGPNSARQGYLTKLRNNITGRYTGGIDYDAAPEQGPLLGQFMFPDDIIRGNADFVRQSRIEQRAIDASTRSDTRSRTEAARADAAAMAEAKREAAAIDAEQNAAAKTLRAQMDENHRAFRATFGDAEDELGAQVGATRAWGAGLTSVERDYGKSLKQEAALANDAAGGGATKKGGRLINQHSPGGAFLYGLFVVPGFMAANTVLGLAGTALGDIGSSQTANEQMAFAMGVSPDSPTVDAMRNSANAIGVPLGYKSADMMTAMTENYRLTHNLPQTKAMTKASAVISRMAGTDPATVQDELAALYKSFGAKAAERFPDVMAGIVKNFDVNPGAFEQSMARMAPIASAVGIGSGEQGMETLAAWTASLMQDADLSPATTQSALRMFASNIRNPSKIKAMKKAGFGDISQMDMGGVLEKLQGIDQQDHGKALQLLELLSGNKSGLYAEDLLKNADKIAEAFKKIAGVAPGTADAYAARLASQTLPGQLEQLSAAWSKMFSNPNALPTQAASGVLGALTGVANTFNDVGSLDAMYNALRGVPGLGKFDTYKVNDPGTALHTVADPQWAARAEGQSIVAMTHALEQRLTDPNTSPADRQKWLDIYNQSMGQLGKGPYMIQTSGGAKTKTVAGTAAHAAGTASNEWWTHTTASNRSISGYSQGMDFSSHKLTYDTDFQYPTPGTPVLFGFSGGTFLGKKGLGPNHGWGREEDFKLDAGGYAKVIHLRNFGGLTPGQHVDANTVVGTSGGQPGVDVRNDWAPPGVTYSTGPHLCWVTDDAGHTQLMDLISGKAVPQLANTAAAQNAPHIDQRAATQKHIQDITHNAQTALHVMRGSQKAGINPMMGLGILRSQGGYDWDPSVIDHMFSEINANLHDAHMTAAKRAALLGTSPTHARALIEREMQMLNNEQGSLLSNKQMNRLINDQVKALKTWGALDQQAAYSIVPKTNPQQPDIGPASGGTVSGQLQAIIDNTALTNGYLNRMANFNVPSDYMIPTYEGWAAYRGPATSPKATAPHNAGSARHATHNAGTGMGGGGEGIKGGARLQ